MHKAQKRDVELVMAGGDTAKDLHALEEVFNQMARLVAVRVQDALVFFAVDPAGDDELHATLFCGLDNLVRVVRLVSQKRLGFQPIEQCGRRLGVVALACGPLILRAPAEDWCARQQVESTITSSMSGC
jgi:hypothetical protein